MSRLHLWSHSRSGSASESPTIAIRLREFGHLTWCSKFGTGASPSSGVSNIDRHAAWSTGTLRLGSSL